MDVPRSVALAVRAAMRRTGSGPLRPLWAAAHTIVLRRLAAALRRRAPGTALYVRGSFGTGEPTYGLSDLDLVAVAADGRGTAVTAAWMDLVGRMPSLGSAAGLAVYEDAALRDAAAATVLTRRAERAPLAGPHSPDDPLGLGTRPGLVGPFRDWRHVAGPERLPALPSRTEQAERVAAWLEVQRWWGHLYAALRAEPDTTRATSLAVKALAGTARAWLWAVRGRPTDTRSDALRAAGAARHDAVLGEALRALRALPRPARLPMDGVVAWIVGATREIGARIGAAATAAGVTRVRIEWSPGDLVLTPAAREAASAAGARDAGLRPLADWRARAVIGSPEEALLPLDGPLGDPDLLRRAAGLSVPGFRPAVSDAELLALPAERWEGWILRAVLAPATEPVSFAVLAGAPEAAFPDLDGWSAADAAATAVAAHRPWVRALDEPPRRTARTLGGLLAAARAALFLESVEGGDPVLPLTAAAAARALAARTAAPAGFAEEVVGAYRNLTGDPGTQPSTSLVVELRGRVAALPPMSSGD